MEFTLSCTPLILPRSFLQPNKSIARVFPWRHSPSQVREHHRLVDGGPQIQSEYTSISA
ncbi:hypothetical protein BC629DRAFT_1542720 [Irpex lacteus]|nr:hypothetical protein BC629DRAFT_1542720 [Irpex lacteus]